ncbi:hypothetical protein FGIG_00236 [Fasciola gigantica]|uniref:Uncharacterized protein n=1 Tax=Fasciola gigantica TaxID=46835 RepID=A0A504YVY0_FASGI|nr:hypothetical protein FGIG_00236 [Fasciola gigantica]
MLQIIMYSANLLPITATKKRNLSKIGINLFTYRTVPHGLRNTWRLPNLFLTDAMLRNTDCFARKKGDWCKEGN